jgi:uncharacterized LabA/DUF88 family protein
MRDAAKTTNIHFAKLTPFLVKFLPESSTYDVVRSYYYDANVDPAQNSELYHQLQAYTQRVESCDFYEVKLGRLIKAGRTHHQKGVDVLLAVDLVRKATMAQFDVAILVAGDGDLAPAVAAAKGAGRTVLGVSFEGTLSAQLKDELDMSRMFEVDQLRRAQVI